MSTQMFLRNDLTGYAKRRGRTAGYAEKDPMHSHRVFEDSVLFPARRSEFAGQHAALAHRRILPAHSTGASCRYIAPWHLTGASRRGITPGYHAGTPCRGTTPRHHAEAPRRDITPAHRGTTPGHRMTHREMRQRLTPRREARPRRFPQT